MAACLGAALSYGFAGVFGRRFKRLGIDPVVGAFGQVTATTVMMIPIVAVIDAPWTIPMPSASTWSALVGLALISTALAYVIFFRILAAGGATNIALVTFLIPVSAIFLGGIFLGERLAPNHYIGMTIIGIALAAIDGRLWARLVAGAKALRRRPERDFGDYS
jgi:drug/metabolite transporter (DMT)-like permease